MFSTTILSITQLQYQLHIITDIIQETRHGKLHPYLIPPDQLENEIRKLSNYIPNQLILPISLKKIDYNLLYQLCKLSAVVLNNIIIFEIKIPLLEINHFEIFKIIPLPKFIKDTYIVPSIDSEFILLDKSEDKYTLITSSDLEHCKELEHLQSFICNKRQIIYQTLSHPSCQLSLYFEKINSKSCTYKKITLNYDLWYKLESSNTYIYILNHQHSVKLICGEDTSEILLYKRGHLVLSENCILKLNGATLHTTKGDSLMSKTNNYSIRFFNLTTNSTRIENRILPLNTTFSYPRLISNDQLLKADENIKSIKFIDSENSKIQRKHHFIHYGTSTLMIVIFITIIAIYLYKKKRNHKVKIIPIEVDSVSSTNQVTNTVPNYQLST